MAPKMTSEPSPKPASVPAAANTGDNARHLSFIQPKETRRAIRARGGWHTRLVGQLRLWLPLAAVLMLGLLLLWPVIWPHMTRAALLKNIPDLVIQNLHYTGLDTKNEPYSLDAVKAKRPAGLPNIYDLDKPEGEITLANGVWVDGKADYGRFDQTTRKLWLGGNVQLFQDKGYQFTTDEAQADLNNNFAWGEKPVLIQGDFGEIRGQGFRLLDGGNVMVVNGPAKAILSLRPASASDKPEATNAPPATIKKAAAKP
jgi:lipopolysaccharide export system protein LptC